MVLFLMEIIIDKCPYHTNLYAKKENRTLSRVHHSQNQIDPHNSEVRMARDVASIVDLVSAIEQRLDRLLLHRSINERN